MEDGGWQSSVDHTDETLWGMTEEIACMWRFLKNNGITKGFHRKMRLIQGRAHGFRNDRNYRLRVVAQYS